MSEIVPALLRELTVDAGAHPRGQTHLSSTSGLVLAGRWLYVVADDEHHIGMLDSRAPRVGALQLHRILPGDLPHGKKDRKKHKPDMEALALLPSRGRWADGALLLLGSGSEPNRQRGVVIPLDGEGSIQGEAFVVDLAALYEPLHRELADLNIEGAFAADGCFRLLQRGNKGKDARNACIDYELESFVEWLTGAKGNAPKPLRISAMELPEVDGVPLGFTDGAALADGGWVFSAAAEDTDNSYADGSCKASAIGWVSAEGKLLRIQCIQGSPKVEGIALGADGQLLMVTDADDPKRASLLLAVTPGH